MAPCFMCIALAWALLLFECGGRRLPPRVNLTLDLPETDPTEFIKPLPLEIDDDNPEENESSDVWENFPPGLCQESVVKESCSLLSNSRAYVGDATVVSFSELQDALHSTFESVVSYMEFIGLGLNEAERFRVSCIRLCQLTVQSLPATHIPPAIDTACYQTDDGIRCDVDVSDETFQNIRFDQLEPDGQEVVAYRRGVREDPVLEVENDTYWNPDESPVNEHAEVRDLPEEVGLDQMRISVANLFRIYPPFQLEVTDDSRLPATSLLETETSKISNEDCHHAVPGSVKRVGTFWLGLVQNKRQCKCPKGSVLQGKRSRCRSKNYVDDRRKFDPDKLDGYKCSCVKEEVSGEVIPATCEDKKPTGFTKRYWGTLSCKDLKDRCHEHKVYDVCPKTCRSTCLLTKDDIPETREKWEIDVAKRAVEAQAFTAKALRSTGARQAQKEMRRWFGDTDHWTREKVTKVLNGVHRLLSNVDYVYDRSCKKTTFAYVRPFAPFNKNKRGRYIFYLCNLYMRSWKNTQIETLTHEASHHETMYTDDFCIDGTTGSGCKMAYGRDPCKKLARRHPDSALKNADNYCFYINDVATKRR